MIVERQEHYLEIPKFIEQYFPEYRKQPWPFVDKLFWGRQDFKSLFEQDSLALRLGRKMIKGALVFAGFGFCCRMAIWIGPKQFIFDRRIALKKPGINSIKGYGTIGALFGAASFLINDLWLYSPVESFYLRMIGHSIVFGLLFAFTYHPTTFFYGCIAGAIFGTYFDALQEIRYPKNFETQLINFDQEKRYKLKRDDAEQTMYRYWLTSGLNKYEL